MLGKNKKIVIALFLSLLMFSSVFGMISYITAPDNTPQASQIAQNQLSSIGETGSTSVNVNYWDEKSVANSSTTTDTLKAVESSTQQTTELDCSNNWTLNSGKTVATISVNLGDFQTWVVSGTNCKIDAELYSLEFENGEVGTTYRVGTVFANITVISDIGINDTYYWNDTINSDGTYTEISPHWSADVVGLNLLYPTGFYDIKLQIQVTTGSSSGFSVAPNSLLTFSGSSTDNGLITAYYAVSRINFITGWTYAGQSVSSTFTIPEYTSSYNIHWTTSEIGAASYDSTSETSDSITGLLNVNTISFNSNGNDPDVTSYTFSFNLTNQIQVTTATTTQTSSPTYTYSQVSGTTNEANSSFTFTGSTPTSAVFVAYESGASSLSTDNTNIEFTPTVTVSNPYYTFDQNQLVASLTGSSTGSLTSSNTASPSFSGNSVTYTSSTSPSWTVNLNLYGNRHPTYQNSHVSLTTVNPLTPIDLYANYSEYFTGESQTLYSSWNGHALTSASSNSNQLAQSSDFNSVGQKTISFYSTNTPDPLNNSLSSLSSSVYSTSVNVVPFSLTGTPIDYSNVGKSVILSLSFNSQTTAQITQINVDVNGVLEDRFTPDKASGSVSFDFTQPTAAPLKVVWTATDQYGYSQSITYQYGTDITPSFYSNKVSVLQSVNATGSYPIELSGVPSGTGYYQQLITIKNPSKYGINTAGSNIQFTASNETLLYAWIQSINSTTMQVWVKNYYGNSVIDMQVLPSFENLFSANGYLGKANTTTDNGWKVFPVYFSPYSLEDGLSETYNEPSSTYSVATYDGTPTLNVTGLLMSNTTLQNSGKYAAVSDYYGTAAYGEFGLLYNTDTTSLGGYAVFTDSNAGGTAYFAIQTMNNSFGGSAPYGSANSLARTTYLVYNGTSASSIYGGVGTTQSVAIGQNLIYSATLPLATGDLQSEGNVPIHLAFSTFGALQTSYIMYSFVYDYIGSMPTISSIGTGSVFQANATTTSTFTGGETGTYNTTYVYMTYNIPIEPSTNYVTIVFNGSWILSNIYPSTFLPLLPHPDFVTIEDVKGFSSVQVTLIEPSQNIGETTYQTLEYEMLQWNVVPLPTMAEL